MVTRIGGFRRRTRHKLQKSVRKKGKISMTRYFAEYKPGERVVFAAEPAVQNGMYFPRYHGKSGIVQGKQGKCFKVLFRDGGVEKTIIVHPVHVRRA